MDNIRKFATVAGFIPQLGVRGKPRNWLHQSREGSKFQMVEQATLLGAGGSGGVAVTQGRVPGSAVWYQHANNRAGSLAYEKQLSKPKRNIIGLATGAFGPANISDVIGITSDHKDLEQKFIKKAFRTFNQQVATYSKSLLSEINNTAGLGKRDYGKTDIRPTPGADMPEEQTIAATDYIGGDVSAAEVVGGKPIGLTNKTDIIYNIAGKLVHIEATEKTIAEGRHHGLTQRILTKSQIDEMLELEDGGREKITKAVRQHLNDEITKNWNPTIRGIKKLAQESYGVMRPTPEQMRLPTGPGTGTKMPNSPDKTAASIGKKSLAIVLKKYVQENTAQNTHANIAHLLHSIGTFNSHMGKGVMHGLTVSHKPHVSVAARLEQFSPKAKQAYEFKQVKKVGYYSGFVSLGILKENYKGAYFSTEKAQDKMKAAHLGVRLGVAGDIAVNTIASSNASLGIKPRTGFAYYIPSDNKTRQAALEDYAGKLLDDMATGIQGPQQKGVAMAVGKRFQSHMNRVEMASVKRMNLSKEREYRFWASPFYGIGIQN